MYTSYAFGKLIAARPASCPRWARPEYNYDNAMAESFFATLER